MTKNSTYYTRAIVVTAIITSSIMTAGLDMIPSVFAQQSYTVANGDQSTIKVTGDATMKVEPDQTVMVVVKQSQPAEIASVLNDQKSSIDSMVKEIKTVIGNDPNSSVVMGQMSINPANWGNPSYSDVSIFTVYSTTSVDTSIDNFSTIVKKLTESGYGFESVSASPVAARIMNAGSGMPLPIPSTDSSTANDSTSDANQVTLNVTVNTKPGKLDDVLAEYDAKYAKLVTILQGAGIDTKNIKPSNVNVNPFYNGSNLSSIYQTYSQVIVKTDVKNIEKISSAAKKIGAYVESTSLTISDSAIEKIRNEVNKQALENARKRAESLAGLVGLKIKGIKNIDAESSTINPYGGYQSYKGLYIIPPYQTSSGDIASSISVEFELTK
jgi:uncharacterized protein YggE